MHRCQFSVKSLNHHCRTVNTYDPLAAWNLSVHRAVLGACGCLQHIRNKKCRDSNLSGHRFIFDCDGVIHVGSFHLPRTSDKPHWCLHSYRSDHDRPLWDELLFFE